MGWLDRDSREQNVTLAVPPPTARGLSLYHALPVAHLCGVGMFLRPAPAVDPPGLTAKRTGTRKRARGASGRPRRHLRRRLLRECLGFGLLRLGFGVGLGLGPQPARRDALRRLRHGGHLPDGVLLLNAAAGVLQRPVQLLPQRRHFLRQRERWGERGQRVCGGEGGWTRCRPKPPTICQLRGGGGGALGGRGGEGRWRGLSKSGDCTPF